MSQQEFINEALAAKRAFNERYCEEHRMQDQVQAQVRARVLATSHRTGEEYEAVLRDAVWALPVEVVCAFAIANLRAKLFDEFNGL
jgi:hypothetical protein